MNRQINPETPNEFNKTEDFSFPIPEDQKSEIGTSTFLYLKIKNFRDPTWKLEHRVFPIGKHRIYGIRMSEIGNRKAYFNIPPKNGFQLPKTEIEE